MKDDSALVREVRDRAMQISQRHGHDLHRYCEHLRKRQQEHQDRMVTQVTVVATLPNEPRQTG
jgi:hypothetical protein